MMVPGTAVRVEISFANACDSFGQAGINHLPNEWMGIYDIVLSAKICTFGLYDLAMRGQGD